MRPREIPGSGAGDKAASRRGGDGARRTLTVEFRPPVAKASDGDRASPTVRRGRGRVDDDYRKDDRVNFPEFRAPGDRSVVSRCELLSSGNGAEARPRDVRTPEGLAFALRSLPARNSDTVREFREQVLTHEGPALSVLRLGEQRLWLVSSNHIRRQPRECWERVAGTILKNFRRYCDVTPPEKRLLIIEKSPLNSLKDLPLHEACVRYAQEAEVYFKKHGVPSDATLSDLLSRGLSEMDVLKWAALGGGPMQGERVPVITSDLARDQLMAYHLERGVAPQVLALEQLIKSMTNLIPEAGERASQQAGGREVHLHMIELPLKETFESFVDACKCTTWRKDEALAASATLNRLAGPEQQPERERIMRDFVAALAPPLNLLMRDNSVGFDGKGFTLVEMAADGKLRPGQGLDLRDRKIFDWFFGQEDHPDGRKTPMQELQFRNYGLRDAKLLMLVHGALGEGKSPYNCFGGIHIARVGEALARASGQELKFEVYTRDGTFEYLQYHPSQA